jgi:hypothetical protein
MESIEGEKFVFVSADKLGQGQPNCIAEVGASKPIFWMSNDPFGQGVSEQVTLLQDAPLVI